MVITGAKCNEAVHRVHGRGGATRWSMEICPTTSTGVRSIARRVSDGRMLKLGMAQMPVEEA